MGVALQIRRGTTSEVNSFADGVEGELILDTQTHTLYVCDANGVKHSISGGGGSGGGGSTAWSDMPTFDATTNIITISNEDGTETLIDISTPSLDSVQVNQLVADAIAAIPDASGATIENLETLKTQLESKIDADNQVQDDQISAVSATLTDQGASIAVLAASATATAEEIAASVVTDLYANIGANATGLQAEQNVRALADMTLSQDIVNLTTTVGDNEALANTTTTAITTEVDALSNSVTALQSTTGGLTGSVASLSQGLSTLTTSTDAVSQIVGALGTSVGEATANISTLSETVAGLDGTSQASVINALTSQVGDNYAAITDTTSVTNGIAAKRSIKLDANGTVTGFEMLGGGGSGSQIKFTTDNFVVSGSGVDKKPFTISNGNVSINGDLIATGTITSTQLSANAISTEMINSMDNGNGTSFTLGGLSPWGTYQDALLSAGTFNSSSEAAHALIATGTNTGPLFTAGIGSIGARAGLGVINQATSYDSGLGENGNAIGRVASFVAANGGLEAAGSAVYGSVSYISNLEGIDVGDHTISPINRVVTYCAGRWSGAAFGVWTNGDIQSSGYMYAPGGYHPFTGCHDGLVAKAETPEVGDILVDTGVAIKDGVSNTITELSISSSSNQKGVVGVFESGTSLTTKQFPYILGGEESYIDSEDGIDPAARVQDIAPEYAHYIDTHDSISMNSLGEGQVNVCGEGGNLEIGDLIVTSSIAGKGKKQGDDIIRSTTVAKVRENVTFSTYSEVKQVACIYLCG